MPLTPINYCSQLFERKRTRKYCHEKGWRLADTVQWVSSRIDTEFLKARIVQHY